MPHQANTDQNLARAGGKQRGNGARLLMIGGFMVAVGLAVFLLTLGDANIATYIGLALMALGAPPTIAGTALMLSGLVSGRASKQKPFA